MDLTEFDIVILITMTLAVVSMSFVFPALGMVDVNASESDLPRFTIEEDRFSFAGERPEPPGTPTNIALDWNGSRPAAFSDNQVWLNGNSNSGGTELLLLPNATDGVMEVQVNVWNSSGAVNQTTQQTFSSGNESGHIDINGYSILWTVDSYETVGSDVRTDVSIEIDETVVSDGGWIGRIPVVGSLYSTGQATAATLAWFGSIAYWFVESFLQGSLNAIGVLVDVTTYLLSLIVWLISTYGSVITGADSWVAIFVALPGILLSFVLGKIVMIGISLLPTT